MNSYQQDMKKHFKLYKAGKLWLVTALASAGFMVTGHHQVKADTTDQAGTKIVRKLDNTNNGSNDSSQTVSNNTSTTLSSSNTQSIASQDDDNSSNNSQNGANANTSTNVNNSANGISSSDGNSSNSTDDSQSNLANKNVEYTQNGQWYLKDTNGNNLNGWQKLHDNRIVFYNPSSNAMVHGEAKIDGDWYYFAYNGAMATGFTKLPTGKLVYYNDQGQMQYGRQTINDHQYNLDPVTGAVQTGWQTFDDQKYYINSDGSYAAGEQKLNNQWYYFDPENGDSMATGFVTLPYGKQVYYQNNGQMDHGEAKINNQWYYFADNGKMATGFTKLPTGKLVYYNDQGQMLYGSQSINDNNYYFDDINGSVKTGLFFNKKLQNLQFYDTTGKRQRGLINIGQQSFNFNSRDDSLTLIHAGEFKLNNQWYYADENGSLVTGFYNLPDKRVYYSPDNGQMIHGELKLNGRWYFFDNVDGHEYINSFANLSNGRTAYYDNNGQMVYGEQKINGSWYHFNEVNGAMTRGFTKLADGRMTYYDNNGHMQYGWRNINGHRYYFDKVNGSMFTGRRSIDGKTYNFNSNGQLDEWGWPFPSVGEGHFMGSQLFGVNPGGEFRLNGFHDGLDFGSIDHPGSEVHAIHSGKVISIGYAAGLDNYVLVDTGEYLIVYQEAFASRSDIRVHVGQEISTGDIIGRRDTSHVHIGVTRQHNFNVALANSFNNNGTWINPLTLIRNGQ